jgi:putative intracellular protease/amidase
MKALIVSADSFEDSELLVPYYRLQEAGVAVTVASLNRGAITDKHGTRQVLLISLFSNLSLVIVVAVSIGLQIWSQYNEILGRLLNTSFMPFTNYPAAGPGRGQNGTESHAVKMKQHTIRPAALSRLSRRAKSMMPVYCCSSHCPYSFRQALL